MAEDNETKIPENFPDDFDLDTGAGQIMSDEDYIEWYKNWEDREYDLPDYPDAVVDVQATVGELAFKPQFSDPTVNIRNKRNIAEHSTVTGESDRGGEEDYFVQAQGNRPTEIEITGWVTADQLPIVDDLVSQTSVKVITNRWTGTAVPENVRTGYDRLFHEKHGFIFEATISLIGVSRGEIHQTSINTSAWEDAVTVTSSNDP